MWTSFFAALLLAIVLLYLPGFFQIRAMGVSRGFSLACAPLVSVAEYVVLGVVFQAFGCSVSWMSVVLPPLLFALVGLALVLARKKKNLSSEGWSSVHISDLALYATFGMVITFCVYVRCLDGAGSYAQIYDNAYHLNLIRAYSESGVFSVLATSLGGVYASGVTQSMAFYPAAWHVVCALVDNTLSVGASVSENAVNTVFLGVVFPLSTCAFLSCAFPCNRRAVKFGALVVLAFGAFPWGMFTFGPLYSNFASFSMLGSVLACFILFAETRGGASSRIKFAFVFLCGSLAVAASQPNAIFTAAVILLPYVLFRFYKFVLARGGKCAVALAGSVLLALIFVLGWVFVWSLPVMQGVVTYPWPSFTSTWQSLVNIAVLSLRDSSAQLVLGAIVISGFLAAVGHEETRWIALSYGLLCVIYVVCASVDGSVKTIFSGFWYNDPYRVAACVAFIGMPLAALGLDKAYGAVVRWTGAEEHRIASGALLLILVVGLYAPSYSIPGYLNVETSLSNTVARLDWLANPAYRKYTPEESAFVEKAKAIIGDDGSLVLNDPYDGSVFSYGENGINIAFRSFGAASDAEGSLLCKCLSEIAIDDGVRGEVEELGARYVLLLDSDWPQGGGSVHEDLIYGSEEGWAGFLSLKDDTPGFTLLLSEGDMRLYAIDEE